LRSFLSIGLKEKARNEEKILKNNIKSILANTGSTKNTKSSPKTTLTEKTAFKLRYTTYPIPDKPDKRRQNTIKPKNFLIF